MIRQQIRWWRRPRAALDVGARWFRARRGLRDEARRAEHAHWDPVVREWRFHSHSDDGGTKGSKRAYPTPSLSAGPGSGPSLNTEVAWAEMLSAARALDSATDYLL